MEVSRAGEGRAARVRIGVVGAGGQLGRCLVRAIERSGDLSLAFATTRRDLDLADAEGLAPAIARRLDASPAVDWIVNAAAHTKVDACESETALAYQVNALAPAEWARATVERGLRFVHVSTDYVFSGDPAGDAGGERRAYREDDPSEPRTVYGASKRAGEVAVLGTDPSALVVRTSWVFGPGRNFVVAILEQAMARRVGKASGPLRVVDDQHGSPTAAADLADALLAITQREWEGEASVTGLLHLRNAGVTTWFEFAREILARSGLDEVPIEPVASSAFPTPAPRPPWSVLDVGRAESLGLGLPEWKDALGRYLAGPDRPAALASGSAAEVEDPVEPTTEVPR